MLIVCIFYNFYGAYFGNLSFDSLVKEYEKLQQNDSFILYDAHNVLSLNVLETCVNVLPALNETD